MSILFFIRIAVFIILTRWIWAHKAEFETGSALRKVHLFAASTLAVLTGLAVLLHFLIR